MPEATSGSLPILEINDSAIRLTLPNGEVRMSPGLATITASEVWFGDEAAARERLLPTQTDQGFWDGFSNDPLERPNRLAITRAELACLHLEDLFRETGVRTVVLCTPADWSTDQRRLCLGILKHLNIHCPWVIDTPLAAMRKPASGRRLMHLDVFLKRAVLTEFNQQDMLSIAGRQVTREFGLTRLRESWTMAISRLFVQATRFDPQHEADVDQALHNALPGWMESLKDETAIEVALTRGDAHFATRLTRDSVIAAAKPVYRRLISFVNEQVDSGQAVTLSVSAAMASLPGLIRELESVPDLETRVHTESAPAEGIARLLSDASPENASESYFIQGKPWFDQDKIKSHSQALDSWQRENPTHVLYQNRLYPLSGATLAIGQGPTHEIPIDEGIQGLSEAQLRIGIEGEEVKLFFEDGNHIRVNREAVVSGCTLGVGDRVRVGQPAVELTFIGMAENASEGLSGQT